LTNLNTVQINNVHCSREVNSREAVKEENSNYKKGGKEEIWKKGIKTD